MQQSHKRQNSNPSSSPSSSPPSDSNGQPNVIRTYPPPPPPPPSSSPPHSGHNTPAPQLPRIASLPTPTELIASFGAMEDKVDALCSNSQNARAAIEECTDLLHHNNMSLQATNTNVQALGDEMVRSWQSASADIARLTSENSAAAAILGKLFERTIKLEQTTMVLYEHSRKLEEKLKACEHKRIKMEAFIRDSTAHRDEGLWYARCSTSLDAIPTLLNATNNNKRDILAGMGGTMRLRYNIDIIDEQTGAIKAHMLPVQQVGASMASPIAIDWTPSVPSPRSSSSSSSSSGSAAPAAASSSSSSSFPPYPPQPRSQYYTIDPPESANARAMRLQAQAEADELVRITAASRAARSKEAETTMG